MLNTRNKQIYEEAGEWLVNLRVGDMDAAAHKQLDAWFRESPHHIRAFLELSAIWEATEGANLASGQSTESLIARARASTNIIALEGGGVAACRQEASPSSRRPSNTPGVEILTLARFLSWRSGVLASVVLACLGLGLFALKVYWDPNYATGMGEQRTVHLADGSAIELNSRSRVRVLFSERERDVELVEGQALFRVAKDHARPFVVQSEGTRVRAVGTQFDVYRKASGTQVTVVEGRVAVFAPVHPKEKTGGDMPSSTAAPSSNTERFTTQLADGNSTSATPPPVLVSTGEQVTVTNQQVTKPRRANLWAATAWTQRELVFDMTPLAEVVQEFNRYTTRKLVVSDPTLADFHVTGVFSSTDPASLLRFLRAQQGIDVIEAGEEVRIAKQ